MEEKYSVNSYCKTPKDNYHIYQATMEISFYKLNACRLIEFLTIYKEGRLTSWL